MSMPASPLRDLDLVSVERLKSALPEIIISVYSSSLVRDGRRPFDLATVGDATVIMVTFSLSHSITDPGR
jgi:hypothetical protein